MDNRQRAALQENLDLVCHKLRTDGHITAHRGLGADNDARRFELGHVLAGGRVRGEHRADLMWVDAVGDEGRMGESTVLALQRHTSNAG